MASPGPSVPRPMPGRPRRVSSRLPDGRMQRALHAQLERDIRTRLEQAARLEIPTVLCFSGNRNGLSDADGAAAEVAGGEQRGTGPGERVSDDAVRCFLDD